MSNINTIISQRGGPAAGELTFLQISSATNASPGDAYICNTSGGAFTVTLPASPIIGDRIVLADGNATWGTNNLTVERNGSTIEDQADNLVWNVDSLLVNLIYNGSTWRVYGADYATAAQGALADTAVQPAEIADFETTTELNDRDTANRSRANHTGTQAQSTITNLTTDLAAKAPLASPALTGTPTAPTPTSGDNSTKIATTAYVDEAAGGGGGLIFISTADISSAASVDFTNFDSTKYDAYLFVLQNVKVVTESEDLLLQTSSNGGGSFDSSNSDYKFRGLYQTSSLQATGSSTTWRIMIARDVGAAANENCSATVWVYGPHLPKYTRIVSHANYNETTGEIVNATVTGQRSSTAEANAVRFKASSGNIESGTITMYGLVNA